MSLIFEVFVYNSFERVNLRYCCVYQSGEERRREAKCVAES